MENEKHIKFWQFLVDKKLAIKTDITRMQLLIHEFNQNLMDEPSEPEADGCNKQTQEVCENMCHICGQPVGNDVFVRCDDCWDK